VLAFPHGHTWRTSFREHDSLTFQGNTPWAHVELSKCEVQKIGMEGRVTQSSSTICAKSAHWDECKIQLCPKNIIFFL